MEKKKYTNKNKFFENIIDTKLKGTYKKDNMESVNNYLCDIDYVYRFNYSKCNIVSQLKHTNILGNKWHQYDHFVKWWKEKYNKPVPDYIPDTYLILKNKLDRPFLEKLFKNKKKWIVKPENASFRAGIHVVNNFKDLKEWIDKYINNKWIIQDYIDNPLKIDNKKIHIRTYVLLIKTKTYTQVLVYNKGYIFLSKKEYNEKSFDDDSNLSGGDTWEQMRLYPHNIIEKHGIEKYRIILRQINNIVKSTMNATIDNLVCINNNINKFKCYKLLAYDILITDDFKLYLGEINSRTVNVKYPIKNMYENLLEIIKTEGPLSNEYLKENNLNYYSIIKKVHPVKGGSSKRNTKISNHSLLLIFIIFIFLIILLKVYKK